jgi:hypothetical protein
MYHSGLPQAQQQLLLAQFGSDTDLPSFIAKVDQLVNDYWFVSS